MREATLSATLVADLIHYLHSRGFATDALLRESGISPDVVGDPDARVSSSAKAVLTDAALRLTGDSDLGLHIADEPRPGSLGLLGYVLMTCDSVRELCEKGARYFELLNEGVEISVRARTDALVVALAQRAGFACAQFDNPRYLVETVLLGTVRQVDLLTARRVVPTRVTFAHAEPAAPNGLHARYFGCPVHFRADANAIEYDPSVATLPVRSAHPGLHASFLAQANALKETLDVVPGFVGRVRSAVVARMRGQTPTLREIARDLAMSGRSIQRELTNAGVSFQRVVDDVRREIAVERLAAPSVSAAEVAFMLGFREPASFTRAFRRWTGRTPSEFRRATTHDRRLTSSNSPPP